MSQKKQDTIVNQENANIKVARCSYAFSLFKNLVLRGTIERFRRFTCVKEYSELEYKQFTFKCVNQVPYYAHPYGE